MEILEHKHSISNNLKLEFGFLNFDVVIQRTISHQ
jgi:hypothetical protein